jgi:ATP-dependent helicase/nuclease subunit A
MDLPQTVPPVLQDTIRRQHRASDPAVTAWVSANAGSGKTHVLTQRVIRLLLQGVPPARILCLTFTKAAAANMSMRVFDTLSRWSTADDAALRVEILKTGHPEGAIDLPFARRLFARTVETPGGLKIQTIHAFCERLLHLFPFEADVGAQFRVIEDDEQAELLAAARLQALGEAGADPDGPLGRALQLLAAETTADGFEALISEALRLREALEATREPALRQALGVAGPRTSSSADSARGDARGPMTPGAEGDTVESLQQELTEGGFPPGDWPQLANQLAQGTANDQKLAEGLRMALALSGEERVAAYLAIFFTQAGEPRGGKDRNIITKGLQKTHPGLVERLRDEQDRIVALQDRLRAVRTVERSLALACLLVRISAIYARLKDARAALDFDDLITRTCDLVTRSGASWVLFKLDAGIDHILVDEAQDTSEPQWRILRALADEFFAGQGRNTSRRTFFAVGDEKQSIYSFQGADPRLFNDSRRDIARRIAEPETSFDFVELKTSFRSTQGILAAVDRVFETSENRRGLSADDVKTVHEALKIGVPSLVELWPPVQPSAEEEVRDWRLPLDLRNEEDPPVKVAGRIARMIATWLKPGSRESVQDDVTKGPRPVRAGDVLILVRQRGAFFEAVIRSLKEQGVPVAGADRLQLTQHIAIMDLMAAGRVALLPQDDLTLACVLKSPLIGLDDTDLLALAPGRKGPLIEALRLSREPKHVAAYETLGRWQRDARRLTPFRFYARLLGAGEARCRLLARLGPEAGDAVDEFLKLALQHDRSEAPSLHGFLTVLEAADLSIKRDMEAASDAVRVMTVHASKGLEAKIVMLPDTCGAPSGRHDPKVFRLGPHLAAWSARSKDDCAALAQARQAARDARAEEYHRLLYVALTRAQERLYIMGFHGKQARPPTCWYDMVAGALSTEMEETPAPWDAAETILRLRAGTPFGEDRDAPAAPGPAAAPNLPAWLLAPAPAERIIRPVLRPSRLEAPVEAEAPQRLAARARGLTVHALLQHLGSLPPDRRAAAGARILAQREADLPAQEQVAILAEVAAVLELPALAPLFGPGSRAEVALSARLAVGEGVEMSGQADRVAVLADEVWVADFKTGRPPAGEPPAAYVGQLALYAEALAALYPGRKLRTLLVYTQGPRLIEPEPQSRNAALAWLRDTPAP